MDAVELDVNGTQVPVVAGLDRTIDVRGALCAGTNHMTVRVYSNLSNLLDKDARRRYGLFGEVEFLERR